jgi:SAM-dependent methyltransferase
MAKHAWFESWFNSPYYHLLYKDRNEQQAEQEIDSLLSALNLTPSARVLDLACGKGRHAIHLSSFGFDVTGLDISDDSITYARTLEKENLHFYCHDMRRSYRSNYFDAVFNLFTSFGYFNRMSENALAMRHIATNLKTGGVLLLDFFNAHHVRTHLVRSEVKTVDGMVFHIKRNIKGGSVYKTIKFEAEGRKHTHREKVQMLTPEHFAEMCAQAGLRIDAHFGDYDLSPFDQQTSRRYIFTATKI